MVTLNVILKPASSGMIRPKHLPNLPEWYPANRVPTVADPDPQAYSYEQRAGLRKRKAVTEAARGPWDGRRFEITLSDGEHRPPIFTPNDHPGVRYVLSVAESSRDRLVYRYDPDCPAHREFMRAIEEAMFEAGSRYAQEAS